MSSELPLSFFSPLSDVLVKPASYHGPCFPFAPHFQLSNSFCAQCFFFFPFFSDFDATFPSSHKCMHASTIIATTSTLSSQGQHNSRASGEAFRPLPPTQVIPPPRSSLDWAILS